MILVGVNSERTKESIRERMLAWRRGLDETEWARRSEQICDRLLEEFNFSDRTVMLYAAKNREVSLAELLQDRPPGSRFCLPVTDTEADRLEVYLLETPSDLRRSLEDSGAVGSIVRGAYDILEPSPEENRSVAVDALDSVLVPGVAFDDEGNRIGYGAGYYDRFLSRLPESALTVGVCFDEQLVSDPLPVSDHDVPVDRVVTERRMK